MFLCRHLKAFGRRAADQDEVVSLRVCGGPRPRVLTGIVHVPPAERHVLEAVEMHASVESSAEPAHFHARHLDTETQKKIQDAL